MEAKNNKPFANKWNFIVIGAILIVLVSFISQQFLSKINIPLGSGQTDDWQYVPSVNLDRILSVQEIWSGLTPVKIMLLLAFSVLFALIPLSLWYLLYRFAGSVIRKFRPNLFFGTKEQLRKKLGYFFIGLVSVVFSLYLALNFNWYEVSITGAVVVVATGMVISWLITIVYIPSMFLIWVSRKLLKKDTRGYKRKLLKSISINFNLAASGFLFTVIIIFLLRDLLFGVNLLQFQYNTLPKAGGGGGLSPAGQFAPLSNLKSMPDMSENIGLSTGGAKDINNFRANIQNGYLPLVTDVTYEGLFYDYYFETGQAEPCSELFCPSYSYAISKDPLSQGKEYYLAVGLNSGIKQSEFERKKLNLAIVLDISASMGSPFNKYYYDQFGNRQELEEAEDSNETKMAIANKSVVALLDHLKPGDRYGMVLYNDIGYVAKPMRLVETTNITRLKEHVLEITDSGSTNMESGYQEATQLLQAFKDLSKKDYENRIIFLTDAQPNTGMLDEKGLLGLTKINADEVIYTTFIGIGVDFNTELVEFITKIKGSNYYAIHSAKDFQYRMDEGFEYMVTPLVFDLALEVTSADFDIEKVYGSPEADLATGEIMKVNTLFPSERRDEGVKGGIVLLKLKKLTDSNSPALKLTARYTDREGKYFSNYKNALIADSEADFYQNSGIRKAILLGRYANLMKIWISDERESREMNEEVEEPSINSISGILIPEKIQLSKWERTSVPLKVSQCYKDLIAAFKRYLLAEQQVIGDETLSKEVEILDKLITD
ncbi:MAG TPA: VWA domain-containing protein [Candidatus Bathyarchaeia archaeon]|nr:VWA domain-containing protein [Candidatus Bathyarchaeia archaeon]